MVKKENVTLTFTCICLDDVFKAFLVNLFEQTPLKNTDV